MWRELIGRLYPDAEFAAPASDAEIDRIEAHLGQAVPPALRELLRETDGVLADCGSGLVWPVRTIIAENAEFRRNADFAELYHPFDELMFLADNGGGDQFAHVPGGTPNEIFVWDHETDERRRVAGSLEDYLRRRAAGDGDDWYR